MSGGDSGRGRPLLVYDGDCGFCTSTAEWIWRRWTSGASAVPWQELQPEGLNGLGLTEADVRREVWWIDASGGRVGGHRAVAAALGEAGGWWGAVGRVLTLPPVDPLARVGYGLVARWRHRLPGGTPACRR
jgi:predicted DCC family thiol-disulfide oxidoreductase YuxK